MIKDFLKKTHAFLKKDIKFFDKLDLTKKYPGYFTKNIFRFFIALMFIIAGIDFFIGDGFVSFHYECKSNKPTCKNEFYVCKDMETQDCLHDRPPDYICDVIDCDKKYIPSGHYGRQDFLHVYGIWLLLSFIPLAFLTNHIFYKLKGD